MSIMSFRTVTQCGLIISFGERVNLFTLSIYVIKKVLVVWLLIRITFMNVCVVITVSMVML
jgi:hypothetical protein